MKILLFIFLIAYTNSWAQEQSSVKKSIVQLSLMADTQCIQLKTLGACPKSNREPPIGLKVRYWQPEVFMETVKMPGDYTIAEYGIALNSLAKNTAQFELETATGIKPLTVTSAGSLNSLSASDLQFNEVHIYDFPFSSMLDMVLCSEPPNETAGIRYISELDSLPWRRGDIEKNLPQSLAASVIGKQCYKWPLGAQGQCMKTWGPLYPRQGFTITPSTPVGSVVDGIRAVSIAGDHLPTHVVVSRLDFQPNIRKDKVQMVYPAKTKCFAIGENPSQWERNKQSKDGHYVWIYWHQRECCI